MNKDDENIGLACGLPILVTSRPVGGINPIPLDRLHELQCAMVSSVEQLVKRVEVLEKRQGVREVIG